jgi:glycosyltransferase involved in cell wall biosynthesis
MGMEQQNMTGGMPKIRVLFLAVSYAPVRLPSDKQFLNDLIENLPDSIEAAVWTLTEIPPGYQVAQIGHKQVPVTSVCRIGHKPLFYDDNRPLPHPRHALARQLLEVYCSTVIETLGSLRRAVERHKPHVIHLADHLGPVVPLLRRLFPEIRITYAKPSARVPEATGWYAYKNLLRASYGQADAVVAFSESCRRILVKAGIESQRITTIPWGIKIPTQLDLAKADLIRRHYNCPPDSLLIVGIPRGLRNSIEVLHKSVEMAKRFSENTPSCFIFAIRPTLYRPEYANLSNERVKVVSGPPDFYAVLSAADAAFAPQQAEGLTALPPLVWLEAMGRRTPVVVASGPGIDETVVDGQTGILYQDSREAADALRRLMDKELLAALQNGAQRLVLEKYDVERIAESYAELWRGILAGR